MPPFRRDDYFAAGIINMYDICKHTQLRTIYIGIDIIKIDKGEDKFKKCLFHFYFVNINISFTIKLRD